MISPANILVVDDESGIRFFLEEMLSRDEHHVTTASSGEEALSYIRVKDFDLVLLDLRMKGIGGMEVLTTLRKQTHDTPVIVLTGHASLETAVEALRHGAHDYLFKPCKTVELRESVRTGLLKRKRALKQRELRLRAGTPLEDVAPEEKELLGQGASSESQARFLQRGSLIVDLMRHVITLDGALLELSPTEFDVLAYLVSEAPRVIPPRELVREVQGYESDLQEARDVVRYHIYRIRRKINEATDRNDIIRTVRGVGYNISI